MEIKDNNTNKTVELIKFLLVFVISFFVIRLFIAPVFVHGESMMPTLVHGDWIIAEKVSHHFVEPKKGDIIVFKFEQKNQNFIKRVIGVPGDVINVQGDYFFVNNEMLEDQFTTKITSIGDTVFPLTVEEDSYFVLGDNRNLSRDSTYSEVGLVSKDSIVGQAYVLLYPFEDFKLLKNKY